MTEKKDAISPARPSTLIAVARPLFPVVFRASTSGTPLAEITSAPAAPASKNTTNVAVNNRNIIAAIIPLGISRAGSRASSAASGTPSTARNSHMAKGRAAHTPYQPKGSQMLLPPASSVAAIVNRLEVLKSPISATAVVRIAITARALITIIAFSASPTPARWMPIKMA